MAGERPSARAEKQILVATGRVKHSHWRAMTPPRGRIPAGLSRKERMWRLLRTQWGRAQYGRRRTSVEPVFGQLKGTLGFRQFLLRGHRKVQGEWPLMCMANNTLKLLRSGWRPALAAG